MKTQAYPLQVDRQKLYVLNCYVEMKRRTFCSIMDALYRAISYSCKRGNTIKNAQHGLFLCIEMVFLFEDGTLGTNELLVVVDDLDRSGTSKESFVVA